MPRCCACGKQANFDYAGEKPCYCAKCKLPDMVDVNAKKCIKCNEKQPSLNYDGEKKTILWKMQIA